MSQRKTIAVDLDDVLAASAEAWVAFSNQQWGTNLTVEDYQEDWSAAWQVDHATSEERWKDIEEAGVYINVQPNLSATEVLKQLSESYKLVIATSRSAPIYKPTIDWIRQHYGQVFSEVHTSGIFDKGMSDEAIKLTKAQLCREIGADYLIDDQLKHCLAVADAGIEAILFGDYPWNQIDKLPKNVTRCADWPAVLEYFDAA
ncbi:MAG TPA: hypothetical protein VG604_03460 [Candidatus Saccharimonadales bacterium]|nr:hypothetical protein [Candidatus Saccharimonadales bacterium]